MIKYKTQKCPNCKTEMTRLRDTLGDWYCYKCNKSFTGGIFVKEKKVEKK